MSWLDPALDAALARIGWEARVSPGREEETVVGDYARGFLILRLGDVYQVARRSVRGEPSLKMWTPDAQAAQKYVAFWLAREIRFRERASDVSYPVAEDTVTPPFRLVSIGPLPQARIEWGAGASDWAEFGAGNTYAAVQFTHYARESVGALLAQLLAD